MKKLFLVLLYFICLNLLPIVKCRGPHHPRGQKIVHQHTHYRPRRDSGDASTENENPPKITQDEQLLHDKEHIREDLEEANNNHIDLESMTDEELEFHYFQLHDFDNNTKLDGLEILQAIQHTAHAHDENTEDNTDVENSNENDLNYFIELIDRVLAEDDMDHDGYLSYPEYVIGRMKDGESQIKYSTKPNS
ncbi:multiple coagulation factor deficiency protein 2 homolog [Chrysoperla carnea]|uniref:multiple coagulation factor deficiency protein 2 homolog n=1 Tax=Chrysoperla carnea TaxID=189513 RepID=UPI001D07F0DD|nr:multiple coagulation factor deficiency protein 2 homolog [Chrysoperla carnea]